MFDALKKIFHKSSDPGATSPGLDFLPDGYADRRRRRRTNTICLVLFVLVVGVVGATFYLSEKSLAAVEGEYAKVTDQYTQAAQQIEQVKQMLQKRKTVADRVELAVSLREKLPRSNVMAEITNALPPGVSLTDCELQAKRLTPAKAPQTSFEKKAGKAAQTDAPPQPLRFDTTLKVTGISYTEGQVSDYIDVLQKSDYFSGIELEWVKKGSRVNQNDDAMRTFAIALHIDPEAEARPTDEPALAQKYAPSPDSLDSLDDSKESPAESSVGATVGETAGATAATDTGGALGD